jgi:hypothetical protein
MQLPHSPVAAAVTLGLTLAFVASLAACSESGGGEVPPTTDAQNTMNAPAQDRHVIVNGKALSTAALASLDQAARLKVPAGDYWYDPRCGACGAQGGPTAAFLPAGPELGAPLRADASGGGHGRLTGVFVNGRELHVADALALSRLGQILPGRYWLDANGNWGVEGGDFALGNLLQAAGSAGSSPGGYNRSTPGGHLMSDGQTSGWFDPKTGASVLVGG